MWYQNTPPPLFANQFPIPFPGPDHRSTLFRVFFSTHPPPILRHLENPLSTVFLAPLGNFSRISSPFPSIFFSFPFSPWSYFFWRGRLAALCYWVSLVFPPKRIPVHFSFSWSLVFPWDGYFPLLFVFIPPLDFLVGFLRTFFLTSDSPQPPNGNSDAGSASFFPPPFHTVAGDQSSELPFFIASIVFFIAFYLSTLFLSSCFHPVYHLMFAFPQ